MNLACYGILIELCSYIIKTSSVKNKHSFSLNMVVQRNARTESIYRLLLSEPGVFANCTFKIPVYKWANAIFYLVYGLLCCSRSNQHAIGLEDRDFISINFISKNVKLIKERK